MSAGTLVLVGCGKEAERPPTARISGCVAEPAAQRVGRPNQAQRLRLVNGWRWAGREALAATDAPLQTLRVPTRRQARRLVLRASRPLEAAPEATLDGAPLIVRQDAETTEIELPASDRLVVAELKVAFPADTVLIDSRVLPVGTAVRPAGGDDGLEPGEWARCLPRRSDGLRGDPTRLEMPGRGSGDLRVFVTQDDRWQALDTDGRAAWRLPAWIDLDRAIVVVENVGVGRLPMPEAWDAERPVRDESVGISSERETDAGSANRPRAVLVYVMDALRARTAERVEGLEGFATWRELVAEGVSLRHHFAVAPNTLPSTKALFTGRIWPQQGGWALRPEQGPTLAEAYRGAGYRTAMFSNNPYVSADFGVDRGFDHVHGGEVDLETRNDDARRLVDAAEAWLESSPSGSAHETAEERVFLYVHVLQPHNPYQPGRQALGRVRGNVSGTIDGRTTTLLDVSRGQRIPDLAEVQFLRDLYAAQMIEAVEQLARLRGLLMDRFGVEETLVVATSDHGEEILEHDSALHGYTLFDEMIEIPALFLGAGVPGDGRFIQALTDTTDVHCWLRFLADSSTGCRLDLMSPAEQPATSSPPWVMSAAASVKGGIFAIRSPRAKLVFAPQRGSRWGFGSGRGRNWQAESLFDLSQDPDERDDLLAPAAQPNRGSRDALDLQRLRLELEVWLARQAEFLGQGADDEVTDPAVERRLRGLGYIQ